jgi:PAS domain-containing protein
VDETLRLLIESARDKRTALDAELDCIGDGITIQDGEFRIFYQNAALKRMMGNHVGELCYRAYQARSTNTDFLNSSSGTNKH